MTLPSRVSLRWWERSLLSFVIAFHLLVFVLEAILWMRPAVHESALARLHGPVSLDIHQQALLLQPFFVNQGFYNLSLAIAGAVGLAFLRRGDAPVGYTLICTMCASASLAGLVLALSTRAYVGAFLQAVPAAAALVSIARARRPSAAVTG